MRICQQLQKVTGGVLSFLETYGIESTNTAAERALHKSVIQRKISHGVQSTSGGSAAAACLRLLPACGNRAATSESPSSRPGSPITAAGVMPSLLPDP